MKDQYKNPQSEVIKKIAHDASEYVKAKNAFKNKMQIEKFGDIAALDSATKLFQPITEFQQIGNTTLDKILAKQDELENKLKAIESGQTSIVQIKKNKQIKKEQKAIANKVADTLPELTYPESETIPETKDLYEETSSDVASNPSPDIQDAIDKASQIKLKKKSTQQSSNKATMKSNGDGTYSLGNKIYTINGSHIEERERSGNEEIVKIHKINPNIVEILFNPNPIDKEYNEDDLTQYLKLLMKSGHNLKNSGDKVKSVLNQVKNIRLKSELREILTTPKKGKGLITYLPSDPKLLNQRLQVLLGSKFAGNNNTRNEAISIMDNLLNRNLITKEKYEEYYKLLK